jgi:hypothetical protein
MMPQISTGLKDHQGKKVHEALELNKESDCNTRIICLIVTRYYYDRESV